MKNLAWPLFCFLAAFGGLTLEQIVVDETQCTCGNGKQEIFPKSVSPCPYLLYGATSTSSDSSSSLVYLNPFDGKGQIIAPISSNLTAVEGLDFSPSGVLYAAGLDPTGTTALLATIDCKTGAATIIGTIDSPQVGITDIRFDSQGKLWTHVLGSTDVMRQDGVLGTINPVTAAFTFVGYTGRNYYGNGIGFGAFPNNILYLADHLELSVLDQGNGAATVVAPLFFADPTHNRPRVRGMDFDVVTNTMYIAISDSAPGQNAFDEDYLGALNLISGNVSYMKLPANFAPAGLSAIAVNRAYETCDQGGVPDNNPPLPEGVSCSVLCGLVEINCADAVDNDNNGLSDCEDPNCAGQECNDGDLCTENDICIAGVCITGTPLNCDDSNPCTDDSCNIGVCINVINPSNSCDDFNSCTTDSCDETGTCVSITLDDGTPCDDDSSCTQLDLCVLGQCLGDRVLEDCFNSIDDNCDGLVDGDDPECALPTSIETDCADSMDNDGDGFIDCDDSDCDGLPCYDDGNSCTSDICSFFSCNSINDDSNSCTDDNVCTDDQCQDGLCVSTDNDAFSCDDGNACTINDVCSGGACSGEAIACDDANECTSDSCIDGNCSFIPLSGEPCADDTNDCTDDVCEAGVCSHLNNDDNICSDNLDCTSDDHCESSVCVGIPGIEDCFNGIDDDCDFIVDIDDRDCANYWLRAFISSNTFTPDFGSAEAADALCQASAIAAFRTGVFKAFVSSSSSNARDRFLNLLDQPWYLYTDKPSRIADNTADLFDGNILQAITVDEYGNNVNPPYWVWTGSFPDGTYTVDNSCSNWTSSSMDVVAIVGASDRASELWASETVASCDQAYHLYCFETSPVETDCADEFDNDYDGFIDCDDPDCDGLSCLDDGNSCTDNLCSYFSCVAVNNDANFCTDGNSCTDDACVEGECIITNNDSLCSDGDACTINDQCSSGLCLGASIDCNDLNECTLDSCESGNCINVSLSDTPCMPDSNECTSDVCANGVCIHPNNDDNSCTDNLGCTSGDHCVAGECVGTPGVENCTNGVDDDCDFIVDTEDSDCSQYWLNAFMTSTTHAANFGSATAADTICQARANAANRAGTFRAFVSSTVSNAADRVINRFNQPWYLYGATPIRVANNLSDLTDSSILSAINVDEFGNVITSPNYAWTGSLPDGTYSVGNTCGDWTINKATANGMRGENDRADSAWSTQQNAACNKLYRFYCFQTSPIETACGDALDNDNDGLVDCVDPDCAGNRCVDDGNSCTLELCSFLTCTAFSNNLSTCSDGNPCTDDYCSSGSCLSANNSSVCDDGNACTVNDICSGGNCGGAPMVCDDGNVCTSDSCVNGSCNFLSLTGFACTPDINPCTDDVCASGVCTHPNNNANACSDSNPCTDDHCSAGNCVGVNDNSNTCSDSNACTLNDHCDAGNCSGTSINCDDGNECTNDVCQNGLCSNIALTGTSCAPDANACTNDICNNGVCTHLNNNSNSCSDNNPCTDDFCVSGSCIGVHNNANACDDNNACTLGDSCNAGLCSGTALICNDNNECTSDSCSNGSCNFLPLTGFACTADTNPCTSDICSNGVCTHPNNNGNSCTDNNSCTDDQCSSGICVSTNNNANACSDGNVCTTNDHCTTGTCSGAPIVCDDGNECTSDSCVNGGCVYAPLSGVSCAADANACTSDVCSNGVCTHPNNDSNSCTDNNPCTDDRCLSGSCVSSNNNKNSCSDLDACTVNDHCSAGLCIGALLVCNDNNECTSDACINGSCIFSSLTGTPCAADSNPCTNDVCASGVCTHPNNDANTCSDNNPCTVDRCSAGSCIGINDDLNICSDGNACTNNDRCSAGVCLGTAIVCNDNNECTADSCVNGSCNFSLLNGVACTADTNACTSDVCANGVCTHPNNDSNSCSDNLSCTSGDHCVAGTCVGTPGVENCSNGVDDDCDSLIDSQDPDCVSQWLRVFVTSTTHNANFGSAVAADALCQTRANAAGRAGTFKALVSSSVSSAASRIVNTTGRPWYLFSTTPTRVADNKADLFDGTIQSAIGVDEFGNNVGSPKFAWTGSLVDGAFSGSTCGDWTSTASSVKATLGGTDKIDSQWINQPNSGCGSKRRLYCFQIAP